MPFADLHCDSLAWLRHNHQRGKTMVLRDSEPMHINLQKLTRSGYALQNFALFVNLAQETDPWQAVLELADLYDREMACNADLVRPCRTFADLEAARAAGKVAAVLTVEEGGVCQGSLEKLETLHRRGVRMLTLTWNHENELGFPNGSDGGLKPFGYDCLARMEELGVVADVSHLSDRGFWDVCAAATRPFAASHSSCRALWPHRRNLTDEMIRAVADRGGIVGVNFYAAFLADGETTRTEDIVRHLAHLRDVGGLEVCALGSDFDGITCPLEMVDAAGMDQLVQALDRGGFTQREIDKLCWENVWEFYRNSLR